MGQKAEKFLTRTLIASAFLLPSCGGGDGSGISPSVETTSAGFGGATLGDIEILSFSGSQATVDLTGLDDGILIVNSTSQVGDDFTLQLAKSGGSFLTIDTPALITDGETDENPESRFHQYLREMETVILDSGEFTPVSDGGSSQAGLAALTKTLEAGDTQSFRVLNSVSSISSYDDVTGELRLVTDDLYIYVDQSGASQISDSDLAILAQNFEEIALPREREIMGHESDINIDGRISILLTCVVNRMATSGGFVTGFFFPGDLYQRSSVNPVSNAQEIFYTLLPDPEGLCGTPITANFAVQNILPGVLAHEYQHMNSFNQHVFRNRGSTEEPWLNECLSHLYEDLTGFGNENPSRVKLFLAQPSRTPLIPATAPTLAERGACLTFLRYLYEQSPDGDEFLSNLYASSQTGVANLETAFNGTDPGFSAFPEFVNRWSIALSLSGTGLTSDPRYVYKERSVDPETGNWTGLCLRCEANDGRGTLLDGPAMTSVATLPSASMLTGTATQFFRLKSASGPMLVKASGTPALSGALVRLETD